MGSLIILPGLQGWRALCRWLSLFLWIPCSPSRLPSVTDSLFLAWLTLCWGDRLSVADFLFAHGFLDRLPVFFRGWPTFCWVDRLFVRLTDFSWVDRLYVANFLSFYKFIDFPPGFWWVTLGPRVDWLFVVDFLLTSQCFLAASAGVYGRLTLTRGALDSDLWATDTGCMSDFINDPLLKATSLQHNTLDTLGRGMGGIFLRGGGGVFFYVSILPSYLFISFQTMPSTPPAKL